MYLLNHVKHKTINEFCFNECKHSALGVMCYMSQGKHSNAFYENTKPKQCRMFFKTFNTQNK